MSTFNEQDHPRNGDGRFRDKPEQSAGIGLGAGPAADTDSFYDVARAYVNDDEMARGLADELEEFFDGIDPDADYSDSAWASEELNWPGARSALGVEVLGVADVDGGTARAHPDTDSFLRLAFAGEDTPDGMESHPDFVSRSYEYNWDTGYSDTFAVFAVDSGSAADMRARRDDMRERESRRKLLAAWVSGESPTTPPWWALDQKNAIDAANQYHDTKRGVETHPIRDVELLSELDADPLHVPDDIPTIVSRAGVAWMWRNAARDSKERDEAQGRFAKARTAMEDAQKLPDGPLRDFLLGERPERTYRMTEGKGRNKRTVTKTYRPDSPLTHEYNEADRRAKYREKTARESRKKLDDNLTTWRGVFANVKRQHEDLPRLRQEAWEAGWPSHLGPAPAPPDEF